VRHASELIDKAIALAARPEVIFASYGDMLRVPGSGRDLFSVRAAGGDVRVVYSPLDTLKIAHENPKKQVVFFAIGFETTAPANAMAVIQAERQGLRNFSVLVSHVTVPPAISAILESGQAGVNGFLAAGHVCTVMGYWEYEPLAGRYGVPVVVTGFEPVDIARGVLMCVRQLEQGKASGKRICPIITGRQRGRAAIPGSSSMRSRLARDRSDPRERLSAAGGLRRLRRGDAIPGRARDPHPRVAGLHQWAGAARPEKAERVPGIRGSLHAPGAAGSDDGLLGGRLRRVLPLWKACRLADGEGGAGVSGKPRLEGWTCPAPLRNYPTIVLGHGSGGLMMADLIRHLFAPALGNELLDQMADSTVIDASSMLQAAGEGARLAFTTDSFVVSPIVFPGGDIGELAVNGTVNDLAMSGAEPLLLSAAFILEEGLPMETLARIAESVRRACEAAGVKVVAGDTKVVNRGHGDGVYISMAGLGVIPPAVRIAPGLARPGDAVLVSGTMGDHGMAVLSRREGLAFETTLESDTAPLAGLVKAMIATSRDIHCLRDLTRGGLAAALNELAAASKVGVEFYEARVPVRPLVGAAEDMAAVIGLRIDGRAHGNTFAICDYLRSRGEPIAFDICSKNERWSCSSP
jgi:hydrogenase expression/formation protein HypE